MGSLSEEGISLLEKGRQRLRLGAAEPEHLVILADDLQSPSVKANPDLVSLLPQGNIYHLDAFDLSEGNRFLQETDSQPGLQGFPGDPDRQRVPETGNQNSPRQHPDDMDPGSPDSEHAGQAYQQQRSKGQPPGLIGFAIDVVG